MLAVSPRKFELQRMRVSFIWHQNLMAEGPRARTPILDRIAYDELFASKGSRHSGSLTPPWPSREQQGFWEWYLGKRNALESVTPRNARRGLVPLRTRRSLNVTATKAGTTVSTDGFLHNWGASFVVTLALEGSWPSFAAAAARLLELRRERRFTLDGEAGTLRLDDLGARGLDALREALPDAFDGPRWTDFSVFSLIAASGESKDFDPAGKGSGVLAFLHAATSFRPTWQQDKPRSLEEGKVGGFATGPPSHLIYGSTRSRAVWGPEHFLAPPTTPSSKVLACQHRNLVLASMQAEALGRYACETAKRLAANVALSSENNTEAEIFCKRLKEMYDGAQSTYRSGSVKAQISQNLWLPKIDAVCAHRGLPGLSPPNAPPPPPPQPSG